MAKRYRIVSSRIGRLKGLIGKRPDDEVTVLVPCRDVHTFGMKYDLDVAFIDAQGVVLETYRKVPPRSRVKNKGAVATVEGFTLCHGSWFSKGDRVAIVGQRKNRMTAAEEAASNSIGGRNQ